MSRSTRTPLPVAPRGPVLVEGGHFTLRRVGAGEEVEVPGAGRWSAMVSDTTLRCFVLAVERVRLDREAGGGARLGLLVGDLALPPGERPAGGGWALPPSYRAVLRAGGLSLPDVVVWGESYCRNQGKRRLLDEALRRHPDPAATYAAWGWALVRGAGGWLLASDSSLEWEGDVRAAVLSRAGAPLCPLVFAGLKRAIFQAGYRRHEAIYARADDGWIDVKLRAAAAIVAQLRLGRVGEQEDRVLLGADEPPPTRWRAEELVAPGERPWSEFLRVLREHHPDTLLLEPTCPPAPLPPLPSCGATKSPSPSSG